MRRHRRPKGRSGRPPVSQGEVRKRTIGVRVNVAELDALQRKADSLGLPLAQWLRKIALSRFVPCPLVPEINREAYADLAKLAGNLNQLARATYEGRVVVPFPLLNPCLTRCRKKLVKSAY
jgi:hypothetical protein